jgi:hypothetical protein
MLSRVKKGIRLTPTFIKNKKEQFNYTRQAQLKQSASWTSFKSRHSGWNVVFDERSGMPHRSFGEGIPVQAPGDAKIKRCLSSQTRWLDSVSR